MNTLNPRQREAVRYIDGPMLVLAGAGSGKTRVITEKIAYLIRECGYAARSVVAVTFTNKAAREMKERVSTMVADDARRGLRVSTFHTLGLNILRTEIKNLPYRPGFSIYDATDALTILREIIRQAGMQAELAESVLHQISNWKNAMVSPAQAISAADDEAMQFAAQFYAQYEELLRAYNAVDFDDLITKPVQLFNENPHVLDAWQNRVRYMLVDEYQDTNESQYQLVRSLVGVRAALTVVGDDDQSIYAWRGARPENLAQLVTDYPNLKVIKLEQNYRSMGRILKAANELIRNNSHVFEKSLWSEMGHGDPIQIFQCRDGEHEAEKVVSDILHQKFSRRSRFDDFAILYRGNHQGRMYEKALQSHRVPYRLSGSFSFFNFSEVKDLVAYLRLLGNPTDDAAFLRVINTPRREIGAATLEKLNDFAHENGMSMSDALHSSALLSQMATRQAQALKAFGEWLKNAAELSRTKTPSQVLQMVIADVDYYDWLHQTSKDTNNAERRIKNITELGDWIRQLEEKEPDRGVSETVNHMALVDMLDRQEDAESSDAVQLMTLHASKGLEYPYVYLVGMEEGLLPHKTSLEEGSIEEERRLAYVGVTRAQKVLTIAFALKRRASGESEGREPSRFIAELPADDLEWQGVGLKADPSKTKEKGQAHLANLRGMLDL